MYKVGREKLFHSEESKKNMALRYSPKLYVMNAYCLTSVLFSLQPSLPWKVLKFR